MARSTTQEAPARRRHGKYDRLIAAAQARARLTVAVAHPCDEASLGAVLEAADLGLIAPILVGPRPRIAAAAAVLRGAAWAGFRLDEAANAAGGPRITAGTGPQAYVIPTDEEAMIARGMREVLDDPRLTAL